MTPAIALSAATDSSSRSASECPPAVDSGVESERAGGAGSGRAFIGDARNFGASQSCIDAARSVPTNAAG